MKNKTLTFIFSFILLFTFATTALIPEQAFAAKAKTATTKNKTSTKKKVIRKKRDSVNLDPPLITLETAPHSAKPITKKKRTKKKTVKKA